MIFLLFLWAKAKKQSDMRKNFIIPVVLGMLSMASCHSHEEHHGHDDPHAEKEHEHSGEIVISKEQARSAGIEVETVKPSEFSGVIPVGGKILSASGDEVTVVATVSGVVRLRRGMTEGSQVARGGAVFTISSDNMQDDPAQRAAIAYAAAKKEYERAAKLVKDKIVTQKEFNAIRADYETAKIAYEAFGGKDGKVSGVAVTSPIGGYVKTCLVKEGDYVTAGQPLMTVTQTRNLYLKANVPERYYSRLGSIKSARFKTAYGTAVYDLAQMNGRLVATGKSTGDSTPYIPVTFEFANRVDVAPGTFVETYLLTGGRSGVISVPVSALTDEQGVNFVYVRTDATCYERREVTTGETDGKRVEIKSGLKSGEKVVAKGAMQVKLASASTAIPGHSHNH